MAWAWQIQYCDPLLLFSWEQIYCQNPYIQRMRRQKREIIWSPSPLRFHSFNKYFKKTKLHSLFAYLQNSIHIWMLQKRFQNFLWKVTSKCGVFFCILFNTQISVRNSQWFDRERKRQRMREWERERGGRGLIGFLWLQLNNIMHILA